MPEMGEEDALVRITIILTTGCSFLLGRTQIVKFFTMGLLCCLCILMNNEVLNSFDTSSARSGMSEFGSPPCALLFQVKFGRRWTKIAKLIGTRTVLQVKSFARQYFRNKVNGASLQLEKRCLPVVSLVLVCLFRALLSKHVLHLSPAPGKWNILICRFKCEVRPDFKF